MAPGTAGSRRRRPRATRLRSCDHCLAWGVLTERLCKACRGFASTYAAGPCAACGRDLPADAGVCRPCRKQASLIAGPANKTALDLSVAAVTGHQLWFHFGRLTRAGCGPVTDPHSCSAQPLRRPVRLRARWVQLILCDVPRDLSRASGQLPPLDPAARPGGLDRPLDEVTADAITSYLGFRNQRWPSTTNPYLLITRKTAHTGEPVSRFWMTRLFRGLPVTAAQLRDDRIVEEALAGRADPLHLAAVFGFGPRTGLRYAQAARQVGEPADAHTSQRQPDP